MVEELMSIVRDMPGVTFDIKWEHHLCFNVGGKMFLVSSPDEVPVNASFKVGDEQFPDWVARPGFIAAPYLARYKWVQVDDISRLSIDEWKEILNTAYALIASKLPSKQRRELGINV